MVWYTALYVYVDCANVVTALRQKDKGYFIIEKGELGSDSPDFFYSGSSHPERGFVESHVQLQHLLRDGDTLTVGIAQRTK